MLKSTKVDQTKIWSEFISISHTKTYFYTKTNSLLIYKYTLSNLSLSKLLLSQFSWAFRSVHYLQLQKLMWANFVDIQEPSIVGLGYIKVTQ